MGWKEFSSMKRSKRISKWSEEHYSVEHQGGTMRVCVATRGKDWGQGRRKRLGRVDKKGKGRVVYRKTLSNSNRWGGSEWVVGDKG